MALDFLQMMLQTIIALAIVCGLAYLVFRFLIPSLNFSHKSNNMVRIVDRVAIDARKSLCVIEIAGKWMLISVSENGVEQICELDAESAKIAEQEIIEARLNKTSHTVRNGFMDKLSELIKKNEGGE